MIPEIRHETIAAVLDQPLTSEVWALLAEHQPAFHAHLVHVCAMGVRTAELTLLLRLFKCLMAETGDAPIVG